MEIAIKDDTAASSSNQSNYGQIFLGQKLGKDASNLGNTDDT